MITRHRVKRTARSKPQAYVTFVNVLTGKGAATLRDHYEQIDSRLQVQWTPQVDALLNYHLEHRIALYDFYAIARRACRRHGVELAAWWDDRELTAQTKQGHVQFISIPDAVLVLRAGRQTALAFVEIDRGRETAQAVTLGRRDWRTKVAGYLQYLATSYPQEAFFAGVPEPIILTVTTNRPRLLSLIDATHVAGGDDRFWFTTLDELDPRPAADGRPPTPAYDAFWHAIWTTGGGQHPRSLRLLLHECGLSGSTSPTAS